VYTYRVYLQSILTVYTYTIYLHYILTVYTYSYTYRIVHRNLQLSTKSKAAIFCTVNVLIF